MALRLRKSAAWPILVLAIALGLITTATPATAATGSGTGTGVYEVTYEQLTTPLCRKFTSLTYTGYFVGSYTAVDRSDPSRQATYEGPIQVQMRATDTFWYANPETIYADPACTVPRPQGIEVAWNVMKAPALGMPEASAGNVECQMTGNYRRFDRVAVEISGTGTCQVSDPVTHVTVTQSPTRQVITSFVHTCERQPPTEHHSKCESIDSFVATEDAPTT